MPALERGRVSFKEKKVIFLRLFSGYMAQVAPFAFLAFYASAGQLRFPARMLAVLTTALISCLAAVFAGAGVYLQRLFPPDLTLFGVVNLVFCVSLLPCLIFYLVSVNAPWQKKLFVLSFTVTGAALASTIGNTIVENISIPGSPDGLPYRSWALFIQLIFAVVIFKVTTKGQHLGIGLQSVTAIAEKYSGFAEFSHQEDVFHSSVMLSLPAVRADAPAVFS